MAVCRIQGGQLTDSNGKRIREFGINCSDLFKDWRGGGGANSEAPANPVVYTPAQNYNAVFDAMRSMNCRFVRFMVSAYSTKTYRIGVVQSQGQYLAALDSLVAAAENKGILLVPSIAFSPAAIPPMYGENLASYGNTASQTMIEVRRLTSLLVDRYKNSPAIGYWELCNEAESRTRNPPAAPSYTSAVTMEQPASWTSADGWSLASSQAPSTAAIYTADFRSTAAAADPNAITTSGFAGMTSFIHTRYDISHYIAYQLEHDKTHTQSIHPYDATGFQTSGARGLGAFLRAAKMAYAAVGKPLIVGEFGYDQQLLVNGSPAINAFNNQIEQLIYADVDLAMVWEYRAFLGDGNWSIYDNTPESAQFLAAFRDGCARYNVLA